MRIFMGTVFDSGGRPIIDTVLSDDQLEILKTDAVLHVPIWAGLRTGSIICDSEPPPDIPTCPFATLYRGRINGTAGYVVLARDEDSARKLPKAETGYIFGRSNPVRVMYGHPPEYLGHSRAWESHEDDAVFFSSRKEIIDYACPVYTAYPGYLYSLEPVIKCGDRIYFDAAREPEIIFYKTKIIFE